MEDYEVTENLLAPKKEENNPQKPEPMKPMKNSTKIFFIVLAAVLAVSCILAYGMRGQDTEDSDPETNGSKYKYGNYNVNLAHYSTQLEPYAGGRIAANGDIYNSYLYLEYSYDKSYNRSFANLSGEDATADLNFNEEGGGTPSLNVYREYIYYCSDDRIRRMKTDGSNRSVVCKKIDGMTPRLFHVYDGKIYAFFADDNHAHMVAPGMVYLSQPTEYGTLYSKAELQAISDVCRAYGLKLYVDGARLAYALSCPENDVTLPDLARLCDVFYIGGTKCGALLGEAVVIPSKGLLPHFFTVIKQHGALLAKGRVLGIQFDRLFTDGLYFRIGQSAITFANQIRRALREKGYELAFSSPTNQIFVILNQNELKRLTQAAELGFWEKYDDERTVMRIATSWATTQEDVTRLIEIL